MDQLFLDALGGDAGMPDVAPGILDRSVDLDGMDVDPSVVPPFWVQPDAAGAAAPHEHDGNGAQLPQAAVAAAAAQNGPAPAVAQQPAAAGDQQQQSAPQVGGAQAGGGQEMTPDERLVRLV